jgi:hypothetical protein
MARVSYPTKVQIALAAGTALLVSFVVGAKTVQASAKRRRNPASPYRWDPIQAREIMNDVLQRTGEQDRSFLASETAARMCEGQTFPPKPGCPGAKYVWDRVTLIANTLPIVGLPSMGGFEWVLHDPDDADYPWEEPSLHADNEPIPGMFVTSGTDLEVLVRRALHHALVMAKLDPALATGTSSTSKRLRREMRQLIVGSRWNDALYSQAESSYASNKHGRRLNLEPVHANNLILMADDEQPKRNISLEGVPLSYESSGPLLWIPAIDLAALWESIPSVQPYRWLDGTSTQEPPPIVQSIGLDLNGVVL